MKQFFILLGFTLFISLGPLFSQEYTNFEWQYPEYGGHSLNRVRWIQDETFIAVGDQGMIVISVDNGITWTIKPIQTERNLKGIFVKNPQSIFVIGSYDNSGAELYHSEDGGETWTLIFEYASSGLRDIHFADENVGYIVGSLGKVIKTTDGGLTWNDFSNSSITGDLQCVWFVNADTGYVGKTTSFGMYKTDNGGLTWSQNFGFFPTSCYSIHFVNDTMGWAGSYGNAIFRTVNGGQLWAMQQNPNLSEPIRAIAFADSVRGVAIGNNYLYRTSNATTWSGTFYSGNFRGAAISPTGNAIVTNNIGGIRQSSTYGLNLVERNVETGYSVFRRVKFLTNTTGWVGGDDGKILRTTNSGETWSTMTNVPYYSYANDMAALSVNKVILATSEGTLVSTTNAGSSFTETVLDASIQLNCIHFPNSSTGYVGGDNGKLWKTINGGSSYSLVNAGLTQDINELFFPSSATGYLIDGFSAFKKTSNSGLTWTNLNGGGLGVPSQLYFLNDSTGYMVNVNGDVFRTVDGGATINPAGSTCIKTPFDMHFINDSTGFVVGSFSNSTCDISYTTNRGLTWNPMLFPYAYAGWGVFALDTATVFLVGQNQTIIRSGTGEIVTKIDDVQGATNTMIYPNPSRDVIYHKKSDTIKSWHLFTIEGQLVNSGSDFPIQTTALHSGLYLLETTEISGQRSFEKIQINR